MRAIRRVFQLIILGSLLLTLAGCFQAAGNAIEPTIINSTATPSYVPPTITPTPFITAISTEGYKTPADAPSPTINPLPTENVPNASAPVSTVSASLTVVSTTSTLPGTPDASLPSSAPASVSPVASLSLSLTAPSTASAELLSSPTPFATEGPCVHTVQPGEHLYAIARQYKVTYEELLAANPRFAANPDRVQPGDVLQIPKCNVGSPAPSAAAAITSAASPQPSALASASPVANGKPYTVVAGDTLGTIARKFNVTVKQIKEANNLSSDDLSIGQQLIIPAVPG